MLQIAVCDEEERERDYLEKLISEWGACKIAKFASGAQLLNNENDYDVLLLNIGSKEPNGIETARQIRKKSDAVIVFITSQKEHVFEAFDVQAYHYLLKPVDEEKLREVFRAAIHKHGQVKSEKEPLIIRSKGTCVNIKRETIRYVENDGRKVILHYNEEEISYYARMDDLERQLGGNFYRCHRGYLVNFFFVASYEGDRIILKNGEEILLSKQKHENFSQAYRLFLKEGKK